MSILGVLLASLVGLWCLALLTNRGRLRQALRLTFSEPALLVPATMASVGCAWLLAVQHGPTLHENPFGLFTARSLGVGRPAHWLVLGLVAVTMAGHVGILQAWREGKRLDGFAFFDGVKRHAITIALGKVLLFGGIYLLSDLDPGSLFRAVYIVPNLLLAPLVGIAALHPHRPLRAIAATLRTSFHQFNGVGNVVFGQVVFIFGTFYAASRLAHTSLTFDHLAYGASTLSYNFFPYALLFSGPLGLALVVLNGLAASVFVTSHFLCAQLGYDTETDEARRAEAEAISESRAPAPDAAD